MYKGTSRVLSFLLLLSSTVALSQQPVGPTLFQLTRKAGFVFSGTVLSVQKLRGSTGEANSVAITFRVDKGVRGTKTGETLTIREWAGLWNSGERYRPGERLFVFLYPPSRLGLTSTVAGNWGKLAVDGEGQVWVPSNFGGTLSSPPMRSKRSMSLGEFTKAVRLASKE
jgi:hypothetical protein